MNDLLGRPIEGEIQHYTGTPPAQKDPQEFLNALDALLNVEGVESVRWDQYTPYFNDGEACVFNANSPSVSFAGVTTTDDYDEETNFFDEYGLFEYDDPYGKSFSKHFIEIAGVDTKAVYEKLKDLESVLRSGEHDVVLNEKFGDPAQVTATKAGFEVEYYEHE